MAEEKNSNPLINKFLSHLLDCKDTDNLIIKGHILTEHALNFFIEMKSVEKIDFEKSRFTFSNKLEIAKILGLYKENQVSYNELKLLNQLRNSIAHRLKYDNKILAEFLKGFEKHRPTFSSDGRLATLEKDQEIFYKTNNDQVSVTGKHLLLMLYISALCMLIFNSIKKS